MCATDARSPSRLLWESEDSSPTTMLYHCRLKWLPIWNFIYKVGRSLVSLALLERLKSLINIVVMSVVTDRWN